MKEIMSSQDCPYSICVFCGANKGHDSAYAASAKALCQAIAQRGWRLINGAGNIGLMGVCLETAEKAGGRIMGVIPQHLLEREQGRSSIERFVVTDDMHTRKKIMFVNSDAAVILPGGAGTLDEFFEILTWAQLGLHDRPIIIGNINGYWNPLIALIDHIIAQDFAEPSLKSLFSFHETIEGVLQELERKRLKNLPAAR